MDAKSSVFFISRDEYNSVKESVNFKNYNLVPYKGGFNGYPKK